MTTLFIYLAFIEFRFDLFKNKIQLMQKCQKINPKKLLTKEMLIIILTALLLAIFIWKYFDYRIEKIKTLGINASKPNLEKIKTDTVTNI